jgi:O-antigen ligase
MPRGLTTFDKIVALVPLFVSVLWLPLQVGGSNPHWLAIAEGLTFFALIFLAARRRLSLPAGASRWVAAALLTLIAGAGISTAFSRHLYASIPLFIEWLWLGSSALLFFALASGWERARDAIAGALIGAVAIQTAWSFFVWWGGGDPADTQSGTFYAPNQFAGYLLLLAPLLVARCLSEAHRRTAAAYGFMAAFVYLGVLLTGSRGGLIAATAGALAAVTLTVWRGNARKTLLRTALLIAGLITEGLFITSPLVLSNRTPTSHASSPLANVATKGVNPATTEMRIHWAQGAIRIGAHHPLTGAGLGTFGEEFLRIRNPGWKWSRYAHNQYLEAFAEGGIIMLAGTLALPLAALAGALGGLRKKTDPARQWIVGATAGLVGGSAHLVVDHDWSFPAYAIAFVIIACLAVSFRSSKPEENALAAAELPAPRDRGIKREDGDSVLSL